MCPRPRPRRSRLKNSPLKIERFEVGPLATNCYLAYEPGSRRAVLVDPAEYEPEIAGSIKAKQLEVVCTINTHGHADHIMGNSAFGFPVFIHESDAPCLTDPSKSLAFFAGVTVKSMRPARLLKDGDTIPVGDAMLQIIHTPGHTPGGISVRCGDLLFSGDTLFFEGIGRTDLPGGDHDAIVKSIREKLFSLPDGVKVYPGHGPETTIGHERKFNPFL